jgi:hypothetical protein
MNKNIAFSYIYDSLGSKPTLLPNLRIACRNIANAKRDEEVTPLWSRLPNIIEEIKIDNPDVLVLLEAGRPSEDHSWGEMALLIENETGLRHEGTKRLNPSKDSFGKAVFIKPSTVAISSFQQKWINFLQAPIGVFCGPHWGNDVIQLTIHPVLDWKVCVNRKLELAFSHFPMGDEDRIATANWINENISPNINILMGDLNTFEDRLGPKIKEILGKNLSNVFTKNQITFRGFDHDIITVKNEKLNLFPDFKTMEKGETESKIIASGWLDHIFISKDTTWEKAKVLPLTSSNHWSDHAQLSLDVLFN